MTGVFNVKKLVIWHAISPTHSATTVTIMDMLPWTSQIRYCHLVYQHATGLTSMTGMEDIPLDVIVTPDTHTMITRIDPDSVTLWSHPHNHRYRSSSCQDPHRSYSRSFHRPSHCSTSCHRSSGSYYYHHDTPHCWPSSHRNISWDDSRSWHKSQKQHNRPALGSSSTLQASSSKHKDKRHKQVTIDDPPSEYYSSDDNGHWLRGWFKLDVPSPTTHSQRGLPSEDTITIAHITDCPTVPVHAGKHYQALIDSGAVISLIRHSTYKQIKDCYKTPIQLMAAKINTTDGSPMTTLGCTALHLCIADFKFTHNFIICNQFTWHRAHFWHWHPENFSLSYTWDKDQQCCIQWNGRFLTFTHATTQKATIGTIKSTLKIPPRHNGVVPIKISGPLITTHTAHFVMDDSTPKGRDPQHQYNWWQSQDQRQVNSELPHFKLHK